MKVGLDKLLISSTDTIRTAMAAIDRGACEIALAVDGDGRLVGTLSDGDIRRALLAGSSLDDEVGPHITTAPLTVTVAHSRPEVLDLMRYRSVAQVPVVDPSGKLVGLHLMRALVGGAERPNAAVIMAGGRGTRLGQLTTSLPKPMVRVAGRPILERLVLHLVGSGVRRVLISVSYLAEVIERHFGDGSDFGCEIVYLRDEPDRPLGTGGALALVTPAVGPQQHPLLVLNGDLVTGFSVEDLLEHHGRTDAVATVAVREYTHEIPYGVTESDDGRSLRAFSEKPVAMWRVNAGIYVVEPKLLSRIPESPGFALPNLLQDAVDRGERVSLWDLRDDWHDIGRPDDLSRARGET